MTDQICVDPAKLTHLSNSEAEKGAPLACDNAVLEKKKEEYEKSKNLIRI
jgi:hypothetical protein